VGLDKLSTKLNLKTSKFDKIIDLWASSASNALGVALGMAVFRHRLSKKRFQIALLTAVILRIIPKTFDLGFPSDLLPKAP